jgi:hypothetical protein
MVSQSELNVDLHVRALLEHERRHARNPQVDFNARNQQSNTKNNEGMSKETMA